MKFIRKTKTGSYWRMSDGRIGYVTPHYARITVTREGFRDGKWFSEPNEIGDRVYQINKKKQIIHEYNGWKSTGYTREYFANEVEGISALYDYDKRNCNPLAVCKRRFRMLKDRIEWEMHFKNSYAEAYNNSYNDGFRDGVASIEDKLAKLLNNL